MAEEERGAESAPEEESSVQDETRETDSGEAEHEEQSPGSGEPSEGGEGEGPEAAPDGGDDDEDKPLTLSQKRRQRRKEVVQRLRQDAEDAQSKLDRITKAGESEKPPNPDDFDSDVEYAAAKAVHDVSKRERDREAKELQDRHKEATEQISQETQRQLQEHVAEGRSRYKDFDAVVTQNPSLTVTAQMAEVIADSDHGSEIAYFLGKNPGKAYEIAQLAPIQMARELGAIEVRLQGSKARPKPAVPDPIRPVSGKSKTSPRTVHEAKSYDEHRKIRLAQIAKGG